MILCNIRDVATQRVEHHAPAVIEASAGCAHEHLGTWNFCVECWASTLVNYERKRLWCPKCRDASESHLCDVNIFDMKNLTDRDIVNETKRVYAL